MFKQHPRGSRGAARQARGKSGTISAATPSWAGVRLRARYRDHASNREREPASRRAARAWPVFYNRIVHRSSQPNRDRSDDPLRLDTIPRTRRGLQGLGSARRLFRAARRRGQRLQHLPERRACRRGRSQPGRASIAAAWSRRARNTCTRCEDARSQRRFEDLRRARQWVRVHEEAAVEVAVLGLGRTSGRAATLGICCAGGSAARPAARARRP